MAVDFTRRRRYTTRKATIAVAPTLPVGAHIFELVVEDDSGNRSRPVRVKVEVLPVLVVDPRDGPLRPGPIRVIRPPIIR